MVGGGRSRSSNILLVLQKEARACAQAESVRVSSSLGPGCPASLVILCSSNTLPPYFACKDDYDADADADDDDDDDDDESSLYGLH